MLLILSEESDGTTDDVIDWLKYFDVLYLRINDASRLHLKNIRMNTETIAWDLTAHEQFHKSPIDISLEKITCFWYRRGEFIFNTQSISVLNNQSQQMAYQLEKYVADQQDDIIKFLYNSLKRKRHLGYFYDNFTVKIHNLSIALDCGLMIPDTVIVNNKSNLIGFKKKHKQCIVKGIQHNGFKIKNQLSASCITEIVKDKDIHTAPETFTPSLVQQYIEKFFELRIFYIDGKCYSAAIFSQQDEKTKIDFRNYNDERPNRLVPYKLPLDIEQKLIRFMNTIEMKTGSIDLILTTEMKYVFLEVNPVGQFGWISHKCNYGLEKIVASYFKN